MAQNEIIAEGAHFVYQGSVPVAVVIRNGEIRIPQVFLLEQAAAEDIASLMGTAKTKFDKKDS